MKIANFVNQYPEVSHNFVRREIQALKRHDFDVLRYATKDEVGENEGTRRTLP